MNEIHDWRAEAVCATVDPEIFYPTEHAGRPRTDGAVDPYEAARGVCAVCPVKEECLAFGSAMDDQFHHRSGMFGGMSPDERARMAARSRRGARAGRSPGLCRRGHDLTVEGATRVGSDGYLRCRQCDVESVRVRRERRLGVA